ncbi:MAG: hypothetical protein ACI4V3_09205 [Faecousia sp.]
MHRKGVKLAVISAVCVVTAVTILVGALWYFGSKTDPVEVVPLSNYVIGYFDDSVQYDGMVTAENLQSVYPSDTQSVTEIFVTEGQTVRVGDALLSYDTTLTEIQLERKRLNVQQLELDLQNAQNDLKRINAMKPYSPPPSITTQPTTQAPTSSLEPVDALPYFLGGDGTLTRPYRWLWSDELTYDTAFIEEMLTAEKTEIWVSFEVREQNAIKGELLNCWGLHVMVEVSETPTEEPTENLTDTPTEEPTDTPTEEPTDTPTEEPTEQPTEEPTEPTNERVLRYAFFVPELPDADDDDEPTQPSYNWVDDSSGYTAAEIAELRKEKQREIRDLDVQYRMAKVDYERAQEEAENGTVYAKVDGTVTYLADPEAARMDGTPILTVYGGGCYHVQVAIGEFELAAYPVGSEVTVMSWENYGVEIVGTIEAVSDTPVTGNNYYYYGGNPNASRYMATVAVPADANLREGEYVGVTFRGGNADENAIYLEDMYIRTEDGHSYVYKRGEDGKLEKCEVRTGASYWGYTAVYGDLTEEDYIAFPYGKAVKEGADTVEGEENYGYYDYGMVY